MVINKLAICIVILIAINFSCKSEFHEKNEQSPDAIRKETFMKVLKFLKERNRDSIRYYIINHIDNDTTLFNYSTRDAAELLKIGAQNLIVKDSIKLEDSIFDSREWTYQYEMQFYNRSKENIGYVNMSFYKNNDRVVNMSSAHFATDIHPPKIE